MTFSHLCMSSGFYTLRDFVSEAPDEVAAHIVLNDGYGVDGFRAHGVRAQVRFEIVLRKPVEPDALEGRDRVDAKGHGKPVRLAPRGALAWKIPHESDGQVVLHPPAVRVRDPEPQHPGFGRFGIGVAYVFFARMASLSSDSRNTQMLRCLCPSPRG